MPVPWFTQEAEKPDIGTVIFKADDYYERLQYITGMWNDNKFLHYEMFKSPQSSSDEEGAGSKPDQVDQSKIFTAADITNIPQLLAYLDRANMKGALPPEMLDFMWDLHKLYIKKMNEYGFATHWMSKKEFSMLENQEKWTKLVVAMQELHHANAKQEARVKRRKRMLKPTAIKAVSRLEDIVGVKINKKGSLVAINPNEVKALKKKSKVFKKDAGRKSKVGKNKGKNQTDGDEVETFGARMKDKELRKIYKKINRSGVAHAFFMNKKPEITFSWDYGKTRLFDRKHVCVAGKHFEFTRIYHKLMKALRFSRHEPVDWRTITLGEVDKHRFHNDCWMVIKGRVYDITEFIKKHPGGKQIMQGAGIDATEIFVAVHPYVVFYQQLEGKQIGTLPDYEEHRHTEWEPPQFFNVFHFLKQWYDRPKQSLEKWKPKTHFEQNETEYVYTVSFPSHLVSREEDWTISIVNGFQVTVIKYVQPPYVWYSGFDLRTKVMDDTAYRTFNEDFNTVKIKVAKSYKIQVKKPIKDKRQDDNFFLSCYSLREMYKASVVERTAIVDGVKLYGISVGMNKFIGCPIGCYVNLRILDEMRPYTPVCLLDEFEEKFKEESGDFQTLFFIIKEFKDGNFTSMLHYLPIKKILVGVDIYVSPPMGNFRIEFLFDNMDVMLLIAGGTGISVMTRIIQEYVYRHEYMKHEKKHLCLFHFVQYREDLIWKDKWTELASKYKWFCYFYALTRVYRYATPPPPAAEPTILRRRDGVRNPTPKVLDHNASIPQELYGYPASNKLQHIFHCIPGADKPEKKHKACVCGPYGFSHSVSLMLKEFGKHEEDNVHYFAG